MPHFELVWVNCSRNESFRGLWRCSFHSEEERFELGQHRDEQPVSCPTSLEMVINSTVSVVKKREDMCCEQLKLLRPAHTRTLLPICHGKLVRRCYLLFCPYTVLYVDKILIIVCVCPQQGLIQSGEKRLYIRPVLQKHIDHMKELTVDLPSGVPHLLSTHTLPVRTRLKQPKSEWTLYWLNIHSSQYHIIENKPISGLKSTAIHYPVELVHLFKVLFMSSQINLIYIVFDCFTVESNRIIDGWIVVFCPYYFSSVCLCTHADFFGHCFTFHSFSVSHYEYQTQC